MAKINLSYQQILEHLEMIDSHLHLPYKEFIIPTQGHPSITDIALGMMLHVGLNGYEPIIKYEKLENGTAGHICLNNNPDKKVYITLSNNPNVSRNSLLATLAHEICHKLLFANQCYFPTMGDYNETLTDIATIYVGFGKLTINGCEITTSETDTYWTSQGAEKRTKTTTHYTGYLDTIQYITAYKIVCLTNNIHTSDYEYGLDKSKLDILQNNKQLQNIRNTSDDLPALLKANRTVHFSTDATLIRDIILLEELLKDMKQRVIQHQQKSISMFNGIDNKDGDIINPYKLLLLQYYNTNDDDIQRNIQNQLQPYIDIFSSNEIEQSIKDQTLNVVCPICGYTKEHALKEHKKIMIRCPKCNNVFYWDASTNKTNTHENNVQFIDKIKSLFKK